MWYCAWTPKQKPYNISSPIANHVVIALIVNILDRFIPWIFEKCCGFTSTLTGNR